MPAALPWILLALACVAAGFALVQGQVTRRALERERRAHEEAKTERDRLRETASQNERKGGDRADEVRDLRKRLEKTKRRAFEAQEELEPLRGRVTQLENELRGRDHTLRLRDDAIARSESLLASALAERDSAKAEVERAGTVAQDLAAQRDAAKRVEEGAAADQLAKFEARAAQAEREASRYRQRHRTSERLYTVIRGELDIAKDQIRALQGKAPRVRRSRPATTAVAADEGDESAASSEV